MALILSKWILESSNGTLWVVDDHIKKNYNGIAKNILMMRSEKTKMKNKYRGTS